MKNRTDQIIDQIFKVLPAPHYKEICRRLRARGVDIKLGHLGAILAILRKNPEKYGWGIFHAAKGPNATGEDRFFRLLVDHKSKFAVVEDGAHKQAMLGLVSTLKELTTKNENEAAALEMFAAMVPSRALAKRIREIVEDSRYAARKTAIIIELAKEELSKVA